MNLNSASSPGALSPRTSTEGSTEGQVCDRCRQKKIKCDGALPTCGSCINAQVVCVTSTKLRRRTTARGYKPSTSAYVDTLKNENADLRRQLEAERASVALLRSQLNETIASATSLSASHTVSERQEISAPYNVSTQAKAIPALLIKHMGRLVQDSSGVDRFAGTTTGVHFMLLVQQVLQGKQLFGDFPESSFKLYLLDWVNHKIFLSSLGSLTPMRPTLMELFRRPLSHYLDQVVFYASTWSCLCPIIEPADLTPRLPGAMNRAQHMVWPFLGDQTLVLFQLALIIMINSTLATDDRTETVSVEELGFYVDAVAATFPALIERADMFGLHGLALLSFYMLLVGQHQFMPRINGILVQCAFSLGLHRHGRRFKYSPKENEMRKRLWWWIYIFDKMTAISHGLPTLIHDSDVDIDYPLDCDLSHGDSPHISLPLPGEATPVNDFIALVHLSRILSTILDQLYTTTSRRNGPGKIVKLRNELLGWNQKFVGQLDGKIDDDGLLKPVISGRHNPHDEPVSRVLLPSLSNMAVMLIHRPGLTFSESTPEFHESLRWCTLSSSMIIENAFIVSSDTRMRRIAFTPSPNIIFQSAMLHIYLWCQLPSEDDFSSTTRDLSLNRIRKATEILSKRPFMSAIDDAWHWRTPEYSSCALHECISLLQALSSLVIYSSSIALDNGPPTPSLWGGQTLDVVPGIQNQDFGTSDAALYDLNHLDYLDPLFETTIAELSHPV
ncbi:fungal-specific transcription factor domain-containing protein [Xylaria sp. FL1042]|nr:fungal-specific transcription factor domain-containing protein [Xylaria sp. FL1042]